MKSQLLQIGCKGNDFLSITPFCQLPFPGHYTFLTVWDIERKTALILSSEIHLICVPSRKRQAVHPLQIIRYRHKCYSREMIFLETFRFLQHLLS